MPSLHEGVPRCLLEAMCIGVPVVATKVGGVPDLIENSIDGLLVKPGDVKGLASSILRLLKRREATHKYWRKSFYEGKKAVYFGEKWSVVN